MEDPPEDRENPELEQVSVDSAEVNVRNRRKEGTRYSPLFLACILIFALISLGTIVALTVLYVRCRETPRNKNNSKLSNYHQLLSGSATSNGRRKATEYLLQGLNPEIDPCEDFYEYACGNWSHNNPMPPDRRRYDTLTQLRDSLTEKLYTAILGLSHSKLKNSEIWTNVSNSHSTHSPYQKLNEIFQTCSSVEEYFSGMREFRTNPMIALMENTEIGMWPLMNFFWDKSNAKISIGALAGKLSRKYGVPTFLTPRYGVDWKNTKRNVLYLEPADLTLRHKELYMNSSLGNAVLRMYRDTIMAAAKEIARDMNGMLPITATSEAVDIVNFEVNLATMMSINSTESSFTRQYNPYTMEELQQSFPNFDWNQYIQNLWPTQVFTAARHMQIIVTNPGYLAQLNSFLGKIQEKPIYNYLIWRLIYSRLWALRPKYRDIHRALVESLDATRQIPSQRIRCLDLVNEVMEFAVGRLFVDTYFDRNQKPAIQSMIKNAVQAMSTTIEKTSWLDRGTKEKALAKAKAIIANAAYPDWILVDSKLADFYKNLTLDTTDGFFSVFNAITAWQGSEAAYQLMKPSLRNKQFGESPATANAWYEVEYNTITVPAGLVQSPVFQLNYPTPAKYGGLGFILGHELSHSMDNVGVQFGPNGTLGNWLDSFSARGFSTRSQCLVKEYDRFCYPELELCVNGQQTLGENIADNGGLSIAYTAYKSHKDSPQSYDLPGVGKLTGEQLFFLSFARQWCGVIEPEVVRQVIALDPHPPDKARVVGVLRNSPEFASAFKCRSGSGMVSNLRCR